MILRYHDRGGALVSAVIDHNTGCEVRLQLGNIDSLSVYVSNHVISYAMGIPVSLCVVVTSIAWLDTSPLSRAAIIREDVRAPLCLSNARIACIHSLVELFITVLISAVSSVATR